MVQRYISHSISNTLHYSSEIHPYVGEFTYLWNIGNNMKLWLFPVVIVVICSHFSIFETLETTVFSLNAAKAKLWFALILVSLKHWKQRLHERQLPFHVVICSHFSIFETLETTVLLPWRRRNSLWFALILVSLKHWKQPESRRYTPLSSCDLLSF